jgi:hypothetical protein
MEEYRPNSHKSKEERREPTPEKKIEKIISGKAIVKKKNEFQKFADVFVSEDVDNVKSYILQDVLIPALKKAVSDIFTNGIDMILYGEKRNRAGSKVSYRNYYDGDRRDYRERDRSRPKSGYVYDDIILATRGEAEEVLTNMEEIISMYGTASLADLYDLVGVTGDYTSNKYGWTDIRGASIIRVRDGYMIKLPRATGLM